MQIFAVCSPKGGVGKSTIAAILTAGLTKLGRRVHVIDGDPSCNLRRWAKKSLLATSCELDLQSAMRAHLRLEKLAPAGTGCIVVDTPPTLIAGLGYVLAHSTVVIVPIGGSIWEDDAATQILPIINKINSLRKNIILTILVPNRIDGRSRDLNNQYTHLREIFEHLVIAPAIRDRIAYQRLCLQDLSDEIEFFAEWILENAKSSE